MGRPKVEVHIGSQVTCCEAAGGFCRDVTACILDRPRHADIIRQCREAGARIRLISDGDVAGQSHLQHHDLAAEALRVLCSVKAAPAQDLSCDAYGVPLILVCLGDSSDLGPGPHCVVLQQISKPCTTGLAVLKTWPVQCRSD